MKNRLILNYTTFFLAKHMEIFPHQMSFIINFVLSSLFSSLLFGGGSVSKEGKVGVAVFSPSLPFHLQFKLPNFFNIYYAEAFAILRAVDFIAEHNLLNAFVISNS